LVIINKEVSNNKLETRQTIKVGVIAPLTGPLSEYGEAFRNGITLAQEKIDDKKLIFIFEDSAYDSGKAISAFNKLRDLDKVDVVLNWGDPTSQAIAPLIEDGSIPLIAVTTIPSVTELSPYILRTLNRSEDAAASTWTYLRSKGLKKIGIIKVETPYFNSLLKSLVEEKKEDETVTVIDTYLSFSDKDFKTTIAKINKNNSYDSIGVFLVGGQISQFYNQSKVLGMKTPTFGTDFFESQNDIDAAGSNINGAVYVNYDVSNSFRTEYKNKFKNVSQIAYAGNGYDTVMILSSVENSSRDSILKAFKNIKNFDGVVGEWNFKESKFDRYLSSPFHVKVIQDGNIEILYQ